MPRDYKHEYESYHSKAEQRKNRSARNKARALMKTKYGSKVKNKDVHHKDGNPCNNTMSNLQIMSKSKNRSMNKQW